MWEECKMFKKLIVVLLIVSLFSTLFGCAAKRSNPQTSEAPNASTPPVVYDMSKDEQSLNKVTEELKYQNNFNTEDYAAIEENTFLLSRANPLSTFSVDVDTASYSNIRRFIENGELPPKDAVRIEEMINYFDYDFPGPKGNAPVAVTIEGSQCPWDTRHDLVMINLKGKTLDFAEAPASNLVFLIDVSGSMSDNNKLPLLKSAFKMLVNNLREQDRVSIVTYAGRSGIVLDSTSGSNKELINRKIENLESGGSTAGAEGIITAYDLANEYYIKEGNNRVILATDGDFNVGPSSDAALIRLIEERRNDGIFLSVLGFGMGNYKDNKMEQLADKGNGNYGYIDNINEAKKLLVSQLTGTLFTIAKDVKIQVEFNPTKIKGYRLIGYENRALNSEDFNDDKKDAGEIGSGHSVTALYEIIPADSDEKIQGADELKYQSTDLVPSNDLMTVKVRYKEPDKTESKRMEFTISEDYLSKKISENFQFAAAVAEFGMLLRDSEFKGQSSYEHVISLARDSRGKDEEGYRIEFIKLVETCKNLFDK
jgi:Ca-activated chloride channel family protein